MNLILLAVASILAITAAICLVAALYHDASNVRRPRRRHR